jgi:hypothetical protein
VLTKRNILVWTWAVCLCALLTIFSFSFNFVVTPTAKAALDEPRPVYYEEPLFFPANVTGISGFVPGDFNNDGWEDVFGYSATSNSVFTMLNDRTGGYSTIVTKSLGLGGNYNAIRPIAKDFNRDSNLDVVIYIQSNVRLLIGDGAGNFNLVQTLAVDTSCSDQFQPCNVIIGDFNSDNYPDLLAASSSKIYILTGKADGTFNNPTAISLPAKLVPTVLEVGDFNQDNKLDFVTASANSMFVTIGNGDGTFQTAVSYPLEPNTAPNEVIVADFTDDGKLDIVLAQKSTASSNRIYTYTVYIGFNNGNFSKGNNYSFPLSWVNQDFSTHVVIDINNDGKPDIAVGEAWGTLHFLLNVGNGNFQTNNNKPFMAIGRFLYSVDLNRDGKDDLVTAGGSTPSDSGLQIAVNKGTSEFSTPFVAMNNVYPKVGDFNSDGNLDILGVEPAYISSFISFTRLYIKTGQNDGTLAPTITYTLPNNGNASTPNSADFFQVSDINQDGKPDVMLNNYRMFTTLLNTGSGFSQPITSSFSTISQYSLAKMDADNLPDLVIAKDDISRSRVGVLKNNGDGTFQAPFYADIQKNQTYSYSPRFVTADFDRNNTTDVIVTVENGLWLLRGNGDGTFQNSILLNSMDTNYPIIVAADFNKDNIPDLVISEAKTTSNPYNFLFILRIMRGKGDGSFLASEIIFESNIGSMSGSKTYDVNLDGNLDIINVIDSTFFMAMVMAHLQILK